MNAKSPRAPRSERSDAFIGNSVFSWRFSLGVPGVLAFVYSILSGGLNEFLSVLMLRVILATHDNFQTAKTQRTQRGRKEKPEEGE
jgi:hypothetical protein